MNRQEYMKALEKKLGRLPRSNYNEAMQYFEEYFNEAGPEGEADAIRDLGSPDEAAQQIITNIAIEYAENPRKGLRNRFNSVWISVLAVCAIPIAFPLAVGALIVVLTLLLSVYILCLSVVFAGALFLLCSLPVLIAGISVIIPYAASGITCIGMALTSAGAGLLLLLCGVRLTRYSFTGMKQLLSRSLSKRKLKS